MVKIKLGVSGEAGSFSEEAGIQYANKNQLNPELIYLTDMEGVLAAIENQSIDIGIFPVVNFRGGLVRMAFDAMGKHHFQVIDEWWLNVQQCLLVTPGTSQNKIKYLVSHPQAIAQCSHYIQKNFPNVQLTEWQDTAKAARDLSQGKLSPEHAVIAPKRSAELYGLDVIASNIQDDDPNYTIFIIVERNNHANNQ
jgi:prephenate dehydratase